MQSRQGIAYGTSHKISVCVWGLVQMQAHHSEILRGLWLFLGSFQIWGVTEEIPGEILGDISGKLLESQAPQRNYYQDDLINAFWIFNKHASSKDSSTKACGFPVGGY